MATPDFLIAGAGVVGIAIARDLRRRFPSEKIVVIDKESDCGAHASGRNSGVLHAGFYYFPDSLKARFTRQGNQLLTNYCDEKKLRINKCGKLVVARDETELKALDTLLDRGQKNGVPLEAISEQDARAIEPRVKTFQRALWSPSTSSVDPSEVMRALKQDAIDEGVEFRFSEQYVDRSGTVIRTSRGEYSPGFFVNAAGLYADKIARQFGFSSKYRILPFKGLYLYSSEKPGAVRTNIYPVPDLKNPFLGVHYTIAVDGKIKIGPTAIPAFWREQYKGFGGFRPLETAEILLRQTKLMFYSNFDFKRLAIEEMKKYSRREMANQASSMLEGVNPDDYQHWGKPGIRAQLLDLEKNKLEMDFVIEGDSRSLHVLNAVSPAFTASMPFAEHVGAEIEKKLRGQNA